MRSRTLRLLTICAVLAAAPSCASRVVIRPAFPPAADLAVDAEPAYPTEALEPGDAGAKAEAVWINKVLAWGRTHHDRVQRICRWAVELKAPLPKDACG